MVEAILWIFDCAPRIKSINLEEIMKKIELSSVLRSESAQLVKFCEGKDFVRSVDLQRGVLTQSIKRMSWIVLTLSLLFSGCSNRENLLKEISDFNKSVQTGTEAISAYYSSLNEQEIQLYLLALELNPNCEIGNRINYKCLNPNFQPPGEKDDYYDSPLKQLPFPIDSIKVRVSLLKELADYSKFLAALAGDDSAEKFQGNIKTLQTSLVALEKKIQALQTAANNPSDSTISERYLGPLATIIGILGKITLQEAQWSEIRKSIVEAEKPVNTVLTAVAEDLDTYGLPIASSGAKERYILLISYYNRNRMQFNQKERAAILSKIAEYKSAYDLAVVNKPSRIPNDLKEAHMALVKLAKSDGSIKDIAELRAWLEKFKDDAEQLRVAINQLAQIHGGNENDKTGN